MVSAIAWSTALSWAVKWSIVAAATARAVAPAKPLVLRFFHSVRLPTRPARVVCNSHSSRIAGEGGAQGAGLNSSPYSRISAASTASVLLRPSLVRAKSRIWAGLTMLTTCGLLQGQGHAEAAAAGRLQAGMALLDAH